MGKTLVTKKARAPPKRCVRGGGKASTHPPLSLRQLGAAPKQLCGAEGRSPQRVRTPVPEALETSAVTCVEELGRIFIMSVTDTRDGIPVAVKDLRSNELVDVMGAQRRGTFGGPSTVSGAILWRWYYILKERYRVTTKDVTGEDEGIGMGAVIGLMEHGTNGDPVMKQGEATTWGADAAKLKYVGMEALEPACTGGQYWIQWTRGTTSTPISCLGSGNPHGYTSRTSRRPARTREPR
jgi:hypothetical protein